MISVQGRTFSELFRALSFLCLLLFAMGGRAADAPDPVAALIRGEQPQATAGTESPGYQDVLEANGPVPLYRELHRDWRILAQKVDLVLQRGDEALCNTAAVREHYRSLRARDRLYRNRLAAWADDESRSAAVRQRIRRELAAYRDKTAPWRALMDAWLERAQAVREGSVAGFWYWLTDFYSRARLADLREALAAAGREASRHPILGNELLPHSRVRPARPLQWPDQPVTPVYARGTRTAPDSADTAGSPLAPLSEPILRKAEALEYNPVRIFGFVQREIRTEWYAGAMKGAERTLELGAGNDVDTAALLVALLRASHVPARFETGVVRVPVAYLRTALGIEKPARQRRFLQRNGRAVEPVVNDGRVTALDLQYTWVAARVPYANYRGAPVDASGKAWVPLMPAARAGVMPAAEDFLATADAAPADVAEAWRAGGGERAPLAWLDHRVRRALSDAARARLDKRLAGPGAGGNPLGLLPSSVVFPVRAVASESTAVPDKLRHEVSITLTHPETGATLIDKTLPLARVDGQRLTVSYMPATREVHNIVNGFGGLYTAPAWLVSLRPQLRLNGQRIAVGKAGVAMGAFHQVRIELHSPAGEQRVRRNWMAGGYYAFSLVARQIEAKVDYSGNSAVDTEHSGARLLSQVAARYNRQWLRDERTLAALTGYRVARPWPVLAIAANAYQRQYVLDRLQALQWEGVSLDAALHITEPVAAVKNPGVAPAEWTRFSALAGSAREAAIFERLFGVASISADKGLRAARADGTEIRALTATAGLSGLSLPAHVIEDMRAWLERGFRITTPVTEISFRDWHGAVWRVQDPDTGNSGYFISGGLAGGVTAEEQWPTKEYQAALRAMYADPKRGNVRIGGIRQLGSSDWQVKAPNKKVDPLIAQVVDVNGNPVQGATVHFNVVLGNAELSRGSATTNAYGIARVDATMGTKIGGGNVRYQYLHPDDEYPTRMGVSLVDVWTTDMDRGVVHARTPFHLLLKPGRPSLEKSEYREPDAALNAGKISGKLVIRAFDQYGNAVSNADVGFVYRYSNAESSFQPGGVNSEDCQGGAISVLCVKPVNNMQASRKGVADVTYVYGVGDAKQKVDYYIGGNLLHTFDAPDYGDPREGVDVIGVTRLDDKGISVDAVRAGQKMKYKKTAYIYWSQTDEQTNSLKVQIPVKPGDDLSFTSDYMDTSYEYKGNGRYDITVWAGQELGAHTIAVQGNIRVETPDGVKEHYVSNYVPGAIWIVKPEIQGVSSSSSQAPESIVLAPQSPETYTTGLTRVIPTLLPKEYEPWSSSIRLKQDDKIVANRSFIFDDPVYLESGIPIDTRKEYSLVLSLNGNAVQSEPEKASLYQPIFKWPRKGQRFVSRIQLDVHSDWKCRRGQTISFVLSHKARVTATVGATTVIDGKVMPRGYHELGYDAQPGITEYSISATSELDGHTETRSGKAYVTLNYQPLPIGHTRVENVNIFNGNLSLNRTDFEVGGTGPGIEFNRYYSLNGAERLSPFGRGWGHSYDGSIRSLGCGAYQVNGGLGGGGRFYEKNGELVPAKGYHGTLKRNEGDNTFDYYTKNGTRYHYRKYAFNASPVWSLAYIEDPDGNRVALTYDNDASRPRLLHVSDDAGRKLAFHYGESAAAEGRRAPLVDKVTGPEGYTVRYDYDDEGRLTKAVIENGGNPRVEKYGYAPVEEDPQGVYDYLARYNLTSVEGPLGYTTEYTYDQLPFSSIAGTIANFAVERIEEETEQNGTAEMVFEYSDRTTTADEITTEVNNFRGDPVKYTMARNGLLKHQSLPEIDYEWYDHDVLLKSRTEQYQNGEQTTHFKYDEYGNIISKKLNDRPARRREYVPPERFANNAIKNRLDWKEDRRGNRTDYHYDGEGNLKEVEYPDGTTEAYTYDGDGNRRTAEDRNGFVTTFQRDEYGYVRERITDGCCDKEFEWNALGHKESETDGRGNETTFYPDQFGNMTRIEYPEVEGAAPIFETFRYDAEGNWTRHRNRKGDVITRTHDEAGNVISETWPEDGTQSKRYDEHGNLVYEQDFRGVVTRHEYDPRDHRVRTWTTGITRFGEQTRETVLQVDEQGNVTRRERGLGRVTRYEYTDLNRPTKIIDAKGNETVRKYDHEGNLVYNRDRRGTVTTYEYNAVNRRVRKTTEDVATVRNGTPTTADRVIEWRYDGPGHVKKMIDGEGNVTRRTWTQHGELKTETVHDPDGQLARSTENHYDAAGNLDYKVNGRGKETDYSYDALNRLTRVDRPHPLGDIVYLERDGAGNVLRERRPNGNVIVHEWDHRDRLLRAEDDLGLRKARTYDANGNVTSKTDARGTTITRAFNDFNELELVKRPQHAENQLIVTYEYDSLGNRRFRRVNDTLARTAGTLEWETEYDLLNRPTHEHDPLNPDPKITKYDAEGNKDQVTDKRGHVTDYEHDKLGRVERIEQTVTAPDGGTQQHVTRVAYDLNGNRAWEKDGRGIVTEYAYDALDRRIKTWRDGLLIDERRFDAEGNLEWAEDAKGLRTEYEYFDANLVRAAIGEQAHVVEYSYYPTGERKTREDPEGDTTQWEYDARNRKTAEINLTENERTEFAYNGNGNLTAKYSPRYTAGELGGSQYWRYEYTLAGKVETVTDPAGNTTTYSYDGRGNRLSATDGANKTTKWYYDDLSRPTKKVYHDGATHYFLAYDASGNLKAERDPNGQRIEHDYDELDRETGRRYFQADGTLHTREVRTYDRNNNLKTVTETRQGRSWTTRFTYDPFDRRTHKTDRFGESVSWGYDKNGNRSRLSSSAGHAVQYRYDDRNRLHKVITNNGASVYDYYRDGQLEAIDYASGASAHYDYDGAGRIETVTNTHNGAEVSFYDYGYDANGNRTRQLERNGFGEETTRYSYDAADHLAKVTYPDGKTEAYTFDGAWNRDTETITDGSGTVISDKDLSYNDRHQLTDIQDSSDASNNVSYRYDDNGNQIEKVKGGTTTDFVYDARNNLRKVTTGGSTVGQFLYDYRGIRTEKVGARGTQQYTHDQQSVLFQKDDANNLNAKFLYGPNKLLSLEEPNQPSEYYLFNALDSPVTLLQKDGTITARYAYDAWGEKRHESGDSFNRFGFTGHEHDEETGLIYAKARYYDPEVARFLSQDPAEMQPDMPPSLHQYLYAYQNPTVYVDPDGRCPVGVQAIGGFVACDAFDAFQLSENPLSGEGFADIQAYQEATNKGRLESAKSALVETVGLAGDFAGAAAYQSGLSGNDGASDRLGRRISGMVQAGSRVIHHPVETAKNLVRGVVSGVSSHLRARKETSTPGDYRAIGRAEGRAEMNALLSVVPGGLRPRRLGC